MATRGRGAIIRDEVSSGVDEGLISRVGQEPVRQYILRQVHTSELPQERWQRSSSDVKNSFVEVLRGGMFKRP